MLKLDNISKDYVSGTNVVHALKKVSLQFRESEFVSVLGPSGCGKTTLLNIVGGLDKYTSGDLVINGVSTKEYGDRDWDNYRNHSVGFVFQSYNLIPHQTVVGNVELALTLSGVPKKEKRQRAVEALERVGLGDQINKLPNQLSGGQMQRVAIARALVKNPDIILADEPTGALDSETSVQVMQILKEVASEKLVIMVTHNPELARDYSTRIIRLFDGEVTEDTNPYEAVEEVKQLDFPDKKKRKSEKKASMSLITAFSLSLRNLFTKKARTFLTSFAGSIGIIGIAMILSLSSGFRAYIDNVQKDTLSNYPLTIAATTMDMSSIDFSGGANANLTEYPDDEIVRSEQMMSSMFEAIRKGLHQNDLKGLKAHFEENLDTSKVIDVKYSYDFRHNVYKDGIKVNPYTSPDFSKPMPGTSITLGAMGGDMYAQMMANMGAWSEMIGNDQLLRDQYELIGGDWPSTPNELVLVVDKYNRVSDISLYQMGLKSEGALWMSVVEPTLHETLDKNSPYYEQQKAAMTEMAKKWIESMGMKVEENPESWTFEDILKTEYKMLLDSDFYKKTGEKAGEIDLYALDESKAHETELLASDRAIVLRIGAIVRLKDGVTNGGISTAIAYTPELTSYMIELMGSSEALSYQKENKSVDILSGVNFESDKAYESNLVLLGDIDPDSPASISVYPTTFENKDYVLGVIDDFNKGKQPDDQISYTDYVGIMMSSITVIIDAITYVLIAFVSISLVVSSIMIGIITYISVLERTKEIGVLRSIGASKRDISHVFNAETLLIGLFSGAIGIGVTVLLNAILINPIIYSLAGISGVAALPWVGGVALVVISMLLTLVAGLVPSGIAARKDPVVALRSE